MKKLFLVLALALASNGYAILTPSGGGGIPGVTVSGTPAIPNLCLVSDSTSTASWGSCSAGSGIAGSWAATTGNVVTTNGASTAKDSGTAFTAIATLTGTQTLTNKTLTSPAVNGATWGGTTATGQTSSSVLASDGSGNLTSFLTSTVATLSGTQTLTNKTLSSATVVGSLTAGNYHIEPGENATGNSGTSKTIDWSAASYASSTLTGNVTYTFTNPTTVGGPAYVMKIPTGAGGFVITWPATVKWSTQNSSTAPNTSAASQTLVVTFFWDGASYYGTYANF